MSHHPEPRITNTVIGHTANLNDADLLNKVCEVTSIFINSCEMILLNLFNN